MNSPRLIKCVVWDLDNTLWPGVAAEGSPDELPNPDPGMLGIIAELQRRGIVSSIASRNDPSLLSQVEANPALAEHFVAPQISWEPKSQSIKRIAQRLNIGLDAVAFVDDSPFERAEVSYMLGDVLVLSPEELRGALDTPAFNPGSPTAEGRGRARMYRAEEQRREAESAFAGSRMDFLKWCDMHLQIAPAIPADLDRLAEMTRRTHQLNSTGDRYTETELLHFIEGPRWLVPVARLSDRFGEYGLIGAAIIDTEPEGYPGSWLAELVMLSCRVEGRGIPAALLRWIMDRARAAGATSLRAGYRVNERNLPIRLLFRQMGFSARTPGTDGALAIVARDLLEPLPPYPEWLHINEATEVPNGC